MAFRLNQAFRILRERGITQMKVGLPENEISENDADKWAACSYKRTSTSASISTGTSSVADRASRRS